mmetsp:Transcript_25562/g.63167  ORF Transcript_25562/g.63167 Transcript_25562/m.63167 type:complete len:525 (+) Transcript_25562:525-2099(+)
MLRVSAATHGRNRVGPVDLLTLPPALWGEPAHLPLLRTFVRERCVAAPPLPQLESLTRALLREVNDVLDSVAKVDENALQAFLKGAKLEQLLSDNPFSENLLTLRSDAQRLRAAARRELLTLVEAAAQLGLEGKDTGNVGMTIESHLWVSTAEVRAAAALLAPKILGWRLALCRIDSALGSIEMLRGFSVIAPNSNGLPEFEVHSSPRARAVDSFAQSEFAREIMEAWSAFQSEVMEGVGPAPRAAGGGASEARRTAWLEQAGSTFERVVRSSGSRLRSREGYAKALGEVDELAREQGPAAALAVVEQSGGRLLQREDSSKRPQQTPAHTWVVPPPSTKREGDQDARMRSVGSGGPRTWGLRYSAASDAYTVDKLQGTGLAAEPAMRGWRAGTRRVKGVVRATTEVGDTSVAFLTCATPAIHTLIADSVSGPSPFVEWAFSAGAGQVFVSAIAQLRGMALTKGSSFDWQVSTDGGRIWQDVTTCGHTHSSLIDPGTACAELLLRVEFSALNYDTSGTGAFLVDD